MSINSGEIQNDRANADQFVEASVSSNEIGVDELLTIRMAQTCGSAPKPAARTPGGAESQHIPNQNPLPQGATRLFRDDLTVLIEEYGGAVPRQAFLQLFEAAVSLNLTNILLSTLEMLLHWEKNGRLPREQSPWALFVDASNGQDKTLQAHSEAGMADTLRRYERLPVLTMLLRVLDEQTGRIRGVELPPKEPNATAFINFLGEFLVETHPKSEKLFDNIYSDCQGLAKALKEKELSPEVVERLSDRTLKEPLRFAESLVELMGKENQWKQYRTALESCLMSDRPSGLAQKRHTRQTLDGKSSKVELRSIVLTPVMLDFLVHRHMHKAGKGNKLRPFLSLHAFLDILRTNYGLYIDQSPPGMVIPQEVLQANTRWLERRLRDLGLLIGVNDAPSMKQLKSRYPSRQEADEVAA